MNVTSLGCLSFTVQNGGCADTRRLFSHLSAEGGESFSVSLCTQAGFLRVVVEMINIFFFVDSGCFNEGGQDVILRFFNGY